MTSPSSDNSAGKAKPAKCPICDKATVQAYLPFCSKRCADVDLHRWLTGTYAVPAMDDDSDGVTGESDEA